MYTQDRVEFSAYDDSEGERRIYAINTNWWQTEEQPAKAELLLGEKSYPVLINRDVIHIFTFAGILPSGLQTMKRKCCRLLPIGCRFREWGLLQSE